MLDLPVPGLHAPKANLITGGQPEADAWPVMAARGVTTVINLRPDAELSGRDEAAEVAAAGMRYHQLPVDGDVVGDLAAYLQEGMKVTLSVFDDRAVAIELPQRVTLEVVETEPVTKGQTASSSYKPAILSNGVRSAVPPHIGVGTRIVVMTADGSYVERAKD